MQDNGFFWRKQEQKERENASRGKSIGAINEFPGQQSEKQRRKTKIMMLNWLDLVEH